MHVDGLFPYPGSKTRSRVWQYFGFKKVDAALPATKENLNMKSATCKICRKEYAFKGRLP